MDQIHKSGLNSIRMEPLPAAVVGTSLWLSSINMSMFAFRKKNWCDGGVVPACLAGSL